MKDGEVGVLSSFERDGQRSMISLFDGEYDPQRSPMFASTVRGLCIGGETLLKAPSELRWLE